MISTNNKGRKRIRLTKTEVDAARQKLLEEESSKAKSISRERKYPRDFWRDGVYFDSYGSAWGVDEKGNSVFVGRSKEVLKRRSSFPREKENYSCHSKLKNDAPGISSSAAKSIVATCRKDTHFLNLLGDLISKGYGIRVIRSQLKAEGYDIPLRTLGRWIKQQREGRNAGR